MYRRRRPRLRGLSVREAASLHQEALEAENRSASTRYFYRLALLRFEDFLHDTGQLNGASPSLAELTTPNVRAFTVWLRAHPSENKLTGTVKPLSAKTVREYVSGLKTFAHWLVREELLDKDPLVAVRLPQAPEPLIEPFTAADCQAMLHVIETHPLADRNRALLYLALDTGVRASELCSITRGALDMGMGNVKIFGKGSKWRQLHFERACQRVVSRYLIGRGNMVASDRIFLTRDGAPLRRHAFYQLVHDWGAEAGMPNAHPHRFRHAYAIAFLRAHPGALLHLQQNLGHTDLSMVRRYARLSQHEAPLDGPSPADVLLGARR